MIDNLIQCCYTNEDGWKSVAISESIQKTAYTFCTRFQVVNSDIPTEGWKTENGDDLNLFEIHGDDTFVYICRTQYGLTDRAGRRNMFSHAFILPWSEALKDPNAFLTIANKNFAADLKTAETQHTGEYLHPFALGDALHDLGMDQAAYLALIRAVYVQLADNKTPDPLYIAYDGSDRQMRELLYCIYVGLPYHLRKQLNVASAATKAPERMQLIFSVDAASQRRFFIPKAGKENVLTQKLLSRFERVGYIDHAPSLLQEELDDPGTFLRYFDELANRAATLGDDGGKNDLAFRIAYRLMLNADYENMNQSELDLRLTEALRAKPRANSELDDYIAGLLRVMTKRGLTLAEGATELLSLRLEDEACPDGLKTAAAEYYVALLHQKSLDEAAEQLSHLPEALFERYGRILRDTDCGKDILTQYYSKTVYEGRELNWELLRSIRDKSAGYDVLQQVSDPLQKNAYELFSLAMDGGDAPAELKNYEALMKDILPQEGLRSCTASARGAYWDSLTFSRYSLDKSDEYQNMNSDCDRCRMFTEYGKLLTCREERGSKYLSKIASFFSSREFGAEFENNERSEFECAVSLLVKTVKEKETANPSHFFSEWIALAARTGHENKPEKTLEALFDAVCSTQNCQQNERPKAYDKLCEAMERFKSESNERGVSEFSDDLSNCALQLVSKECMASDGKERPIPLDVWLTLGGLRFGEKKCYDIFEETEEETKPFVLEQDPDTVLQQSKRFKERLPAAQDYVERKGAKAKAVKRWLKVAEKPEKKNNKNDFAFVVSIISMAVDHVKQMFEPRDGKTTQSPPPEAPEELLNNDANAQKQNARPSNAPGKPQIRGRKSKKNKKNK